MNQHLSKRETPCHLSDLIDPACPWPLVDAALFMRRLARQVQASHQRGQFHRAIDDRSVTVDKDSHPRLDNGPLERWFGGEYSSPEYCPPELVGQTALAIPSDVASAAARLAKAGRQLDPRRIDVYQMGVLFCRLASGSTVAEYLYSPKAKARLPADAQPVVDRALGHDAATRLEDCAALIELLDPLIGRSRIGPATDVSVETPQPSGTTGPMNESPTGDWLPEGSGNLPFNRLGPYRILELIGSGGMGDVYRGYDDSLDRLVAVKVLPAELARCDDFVRRFQSEATAVAKISHPNVVPIHFVGQEGDYHFFAMQYIEGESLADRLRRNGRLHVKEALRIAEQCLNGLEAAHTCGLVHRDVKPGNILLDDRSDGVVLVDFGLVRLTDDSAGLTATGMVMGTVEYMAPEQARGERVDRRGDIYSLGVLLYQLLSGRLPFGADSLTSMLFQHAYEEPFPLEEAAPRVPSPLRSIVAQMMAKQPSRRYSTCGEVLEDLRAFRDGRPLVHAAETSEPSRGCRTIPPQSPRPTRRRWILPGMVAGGCLSATVVLSTWHMLSTTSDELPVIASEPPAATVHRAAEPHQEEVNPATPFVSSAGAVALLTFEEDTITKRIGEALVQDASPKANHFSGEERIHIEKGKIGNGLSLRDYSLHLPRALLNGKSEYTLSAWVYRRKEGGLFRFYAEEGENTADIGSEPVFRIDVTHLSSLDTYAFNANATGEWMAARTPVGSMAPDCWNFIALRLRNGGAGSGELTVRINRESYEFALQSANCPRGTETRLGPADGTIDELAVFDRALSDDEIEALFERGLHSGHPTRIDGSLP